MAKTIENLSLLPTSSEAANHDAANGDSKSNTGTSDKLQLDEACKVPMGKVIVSLNRRYEDLKAAAHKAPKLSSPATGAGDPMPKDETSDLDKACNELKYLIDEFKKLQVYETNLSDPLVTIEKNVDDILGDLNANPDNVEWETTKDNLKVLRSNMTKVKAQLPLLHQTSSSTEARRLLATTSREEASKLPSPYQADGIFEKGSFFKEFQHRYETLGIREKLCLLCFAIFPENAEVSERLLRFWWEGERLRLTSESDTKTVNEILDEFVEPGFIQPVYKRSGSKGSCYKMHPIVRCLIVRLAKQANFFYYDSKGYPNMEFFKSKKICLVKSEGPSWWSKDVLAFKKAREQAQQGNDKKQAEAGTMTEEKKKQDQELEEQERQEVFFTKNANLRILDLKACHTLEELPKEVGLLKMLSYLDLSECYLLDWIPTDLSKLSKLKVLKGFVISSNSPCTLTHLTTLSELEKLSISIHNVKFSIKEEESIKYFSEFKSLTKLKIAWGAGGTKKSLDKAIHPEDKNKTSEASKLGPTAKVLEKYLKLPFLGSSKSVPEKGNVAVVATTAKAGQDKNGDNAKKQKSGAVVQSNVHANNKDQGGRSPKPVLQSELKLEKLDIRCYPDKEPPKWLVPKTLTRLKRLYFRGGEVSHIPVANRHEKWNVEILRLKYLINIKMDWKQVQKQFPELKLLEKVNCPQITFCPCDASGVWEVKQAGTKIRMDAQPS
ncbi:hypothetical protein GOBAR_DD21668 [Gossypium barbadense]|nr:hypothetical protein GOBAR_DD21668 [Gossypium barbadense]